MARWKQRAVEALEHTSGVRRALADKRDQDRGRLRLTVMAEYGSSSIWKGRVAGPISPEDLGLSAELCERVWQWSMAYQADSPATDWDQWSVEGPRLAAIQAELGPTAHVDYRPN
jgi:hypothetical protein